MCVPFIINQTPAAGGDHCHGPQRAAFSGLWAIPSTESGPQPLLVTYNLSSLACSEFISEQKIAPKILRKNKVLWRRYSACLRG